MNKYLLIVETKNNGSYLVEDTDFNNYDDAIKATKSMLDPTDVIYIVEVVGKAYGEFKKDSLYYCQGCDKDKTLEEMADPNDCILPGICKECNKKLKNETTI
jgi:hypothetical protein